ncbi:hypothetical protein D3C78_1607050 [compost metagenome]
MPCCSSSPGCPALTSHTSPPRDRILPSAIPTVGATRRTKMPINTVNSGIRELRMPINSALTLCAA